MLHLRGQHRDGGVQMRRRERRKWEFDVARATGADLFTTERVHKMDGRRASTNRGGMRF